ncbi:class II glutamine amidotransferase [candidate division KSB1 bacterium]
MSRLFGFFGAKPVNISCVHKPEKGNKIDDQKNYSFMEADGWGIGFFRNKSSFLYKKPLKRKNSKEFTTISEIISSRVFISHLRFSTIGEVKEANTQPFRWGNWLFAHSGTIHQFRKVKSRIIRKLPIAYKKQIQGNTDSEYCFYLYLSMLRGEGGIKKGESSLTASVEGLKNFGTVLTDIFEEAEVQKDPELNLLISNGNYLLAARYGKPLYYFIQDNGGDSAELNFYFKETNVQFNIISSESSNKFIVISSQMNNDIDIWREIPDKSVLSVDADLNIKVIPWI